MAHRKSSAFLVGMFFCSCCACDKTRDGVCPSNDAMMYEPGAQEFGAGSHAQSVAVMGALSWPNSANFAAWSFDDRSLLVGAGQDLVLIEVATWSVRARRHSTNGSLAYWGLAVSPDGGLIAAATPLRIELWTPDLAHQAHEFEGTVIGPPLAFADRGKTLVALQREEYVSTWNLGSYALFRKTRLMPPGSHVLAFSHQGAVSVNVKNRNIGVWDLAWGTRIWEQVTDDPLPSCVQFSRDDTAFLAAHRYPHSPARVVVRNTETGASVWSADGTCGAYGQDLSITSDVGVRNLVKTTDGKLVSAFVLSDLPAAQWLGFSHTERYLAETDALGNLRVWSVGIDGGLSLVAPTHP